MHITEETSHADLLMAVADNNLYDDFGGVDAVNAMSKDELFEKITNWVEEGDETFQ